ncbi:MAG: outer membrane lipoprotein carrier protein LolA [Candidatus Neomarinimicrobiota bacterium]
MVLSKSIKRPIIVSILLGGAILLSAQATAKAVLEKVAGYYNSALPFKIGFTIRQVIPGRKSHSENNGTFFVDYHERFRVNITDQEIVYDRNWLWTRDKVNQQVIVEEFNPRTSLKFIRDILNGSLSDYRIVKMNKKTARLAVLDLEPKIEDGYIRSLQLQIDPTLGVIKSASYRDFQNEQITIVFDNLVGLNAADSSWFDINLKENEELIDLRP